MKTVQKRLLSLLLCGTMLTSFSGCLQNPQSANPSRRSNYNVTYNLNYDGAATRVQSYQAGTTAIDWEALREGYYINGWYTDEACTKEYSFDTKIDSDLTLYAGWREKPGMATVTFDFGYSGAVDKVVEIEKGSKINKKHIPKKERFGMKLSGWYADENFEREWNFETDEVTENTVLHAKFDYTVNIPVDEDGNIIYNNLSVYVWNGCGAFSSSLIEPVIEAFNKEYEGRITVSHGPLTSQADVFLRIQQTTELMRNAKTYYPIADIYSLAGIEVNNEDYYAGAVRESESKGVMLQTPFAAVVPYLVYNKTLMNKYSPNGLPTNYSELSAVLQKAAEGELLTKSNFKSILTMNTWQFKENSSYTAFAQNNADYYTYKNDINVCEWKDKAVMARAQTALQITYDLFGVNGLNKGASSSYSAGDIASIVKKGDALMGLLSWHGAENAILQDSNLGVMPLSGMFTDATDEASRRVPVYTLGVAFYNGASNVIADPVKMCASAVFADYLSKNAHLFADKGYMPVHKATANEESFANSTNPVVQLLKSICDPNDYWTLSGMTNIKYLINTVASEGVIVPYLQDVNATRDDVPAQLNKLYSQVGGLLA